MLAHHLGSINHLGSHIGLLINFMKAGMVGTEPPVNSQRYCGWSFGLSGTLTMAVMGPCRSLAIHPYGRLNFHPQGHAHPY